MELSGKKIVIPVENMFNTHEFWYPYFRLKEAGCEVVVMGSGSAETYTGKPGTEVTVDVSVGAPLCLPVAEQQGKQLQVGQVRQGVVRSPRDRQSLVCARIGQEHLKCRRWMPLQIHEGRRPLAELVLDHGDRPRVDGLPPPCRFHAPGQSRLLGILAQLPLAMIIVSHNRAFREHLATRTLELRDGHHRDVMCDA